MRTFLPLSAVAAASVLLLSGCGIEGTQFHPGIAAVVADDSITTNHIDSLADHYCTAIRPQIKQSQRVLPMRYLRAGIAGELVIRDAAQQLAKDYGVVPGDQYNQAVSQSQAGVATLSTDTAAAVVEVDTIDPYVDSVLTQIGSLTLAKQGTTGATPDQKLAEGKKVMSSWFSDHKVEIDPRFGIVIKDGQPVSADTDLSLPVSVTAKDGLATSPDAAYSDALPATSVCG